MSLDVGSGCGWVLGMGSDSGLCCGRELVMGWEVDRGCDCG